MDCLKSFTVRSVAERLEVSALPPLKAEVDPLDRAIRAITNPTKPRTRYRKKTSGAAIAPAGGVDAGGGGDDESDEETSDGGSTSSHSTIAPDEQPRQRPEPAPARPASVNPKAFFWREEDLGVKRIEFEYGRDSRCMTCGLTIPKRSGLPRLVYAYHTKRPHCYIHLKCCLNLEERFVVGAEAVVSAASDDAPPSAKQAVKDALHELRRRLKASTLDADYQRRRLKADSD